MKKNKNLLLVVLMAAMSAIITSCSSDDDFKSSGKTGLKGIVEIDASDSKMFDRLLAYGDGVIAYKEDAFSKTKKPATKAVTNTDYLNTSITVALTQTDPVTGEVTVGMPLLCLTTSFSQENLNYGYLPRKASFYVGDHMCNMVISDPKRNGSNVEISLTALNLKTVTNSRYVGTYDMRNTYGRKYINDPIKSALWNFSELLSMIDDNATIILDGTEHKMREITQSILVPLSTILNLDYTHNDEQAIEVATNLWTGGPSILTKIESFYENTILIDKRELTINPYRTYYQMTNDTYRMCGYIDVPGFDVHVDELKKLGRFGFAISHLFVEKSHPDFSIFDKIIYADSDDDYYNFFGSISGLEQNRTYYVRPFFQFNSSDHGYFTPKFIAQTYSLVSPDGNTFFAEDAMPLKTKDMRLGIKHVMLIDAANIQDAYGKSYGPIVFAWTERGNWYGREIEVAHRKSQLYIYTNDDMKKPNWLLGCAAEDINYDNDANTPFWQLVGSIADHNPYYERTEAPSNMLDALNKVLDDKTLVSDDPNSRTAIFVITNRPIAADTISKKNVSYGEFVEKWKRLPSGKRLIIQAPCYTNSQWRDLLISNNDPIATWEQFRGLENTAVFDINVDGSTPGWNTNPNYVDLYSGYNIIGFIMGEK